MTGKPDKRCDIYEFKPPHLNLVFVELMKLIYPRLLKYRYGDFSFDIRGGTEEVTRLSTNRVILCPNHASIMDTDIAFLLTTLLNDQLYYLCAREIFRGTFANRHLLQMAGCYSVRRGTLDSNSFATSIKILKDGRHKLVIFPEGEICGRNDVLLPFKSGPAHIALSAVQQMRKEQSEQPIYLAPIALRYKYPKITAKFLMRSMRQIETSLGIEADLEQSLQARLGKASKVILDVLAKKYDFTPEPGNIRERASQVSRVILESIAKYVGFKPDTRLDEIESAHQLYMRLYEYRWEEQQLAHKLNPENHKQRHRLLHELIHDYHRAVNLISAGLTAEKSNQDDLINLMMAIKREVRPKEPWRIPVHLSVSFGTPVLVNDYVKRETGKAVAMHNITDRLEKEIKEQLAKLID
jgi:1-acyl-sn-glycerol-3-phosphate acyltransferase